jgi:hypothetical protein
LAQAPKNPSFKDRASYLTHILIYGRIVRSFNPTKRGSGIKVGLRVVRSFCCIGLNKWIFPLNPTTISLLYKKLLFLSSKDTGIYLWKIKTGIRPYNCAFLVGLSGINGDFAVLYKETTVPLLIPLNPTRHFGGSIWLS